MTNQKAPKLVVIVGETASGKSALAMEIAKRFSGEIVNADSRQVYKGMNIGTAKPTAAQQAEIPHHLLDVVSPTRSFTAADFKRLANHSIVDISGRSRLPVLVGGTGLYVDGVLFDFKFGPPNPALRKKLANFTSNQLLALIEQQSIDITGVDTSNPRRLIRLLETGGRQTTRAQEIRPNTLIVGLKIPRNQLRVRIEQRVEGMFRQGLRHEVRELVTVYGWDNEALKGIGYREFKPYFAGEISLAAVKRQIVQSTLNLAKRQRTWFKRNRHIRWVERADQALELVTLFLEH
ncbi:tRNA (adenosine(37)-N6)-dimethylallyltransferase MiaA [Candidatus Microgenomates bacterium]|nr:tRNA (adenosine(37)-N6)-dimethylallyltransferase MiaA [Candidatus Microgenomates bacterium]